MLSHTVASLPQSNSGNPSAGAWDIEQGHVLARLQPLSTPSTGVLQRPLVPLFLVSMRGYLGKHPALLSGLSVGLASAISAGLTHPVGAAFSQAMAENLRGIRWQDATFRGVDTNMLRALVKWGLIDVSNIYILQGLTALAQSCQGTGFDHARVGAASVLTALLVSVLLCPAERIQQFQMQHNVGMLSSMQRMMAENGMSTFFTGSTSAFINTLPAVLIRSFAEAMCQGDKSREKAMINRLTLIISPLKTYLAVVKQVQQTYETPIAEAFGIAGKQVLEKPHLLLFHMVASMLFAAVANQIYFLAKDQMDGVVARVSDFKEGEPPEMQERQEIQGKKEKDA